VAGAAEGASGQKRKISISLDDDAADDLRFGYSEEEAGFWFDGWSDNTCVLVHVYDVEDDQN